MIYSVTIMIGGSSPTISNDYFANISSSQVIPNSGVITVSGGSPQIVGNVINVPPATSTAMDGIFVGSGSPTISSNLIAGPSQNSGIYGIYISIGGYASISNNNITDCYSGIDTVGQSSIQNNVIMNNVNDGVVSTNTFSTIWNNVLANNLCGVSGDGNIQNNTIADNAVGIWGPSASDIVSYNNIFGNPQSIHLVDFSNLYAVNNWWGTNDTSSINQTIWDFKGDPYHLGNVTFVPFLNQSNPFAPTIPTSIVIPTPPATPTPVSSPSPTPNMTPYYTPTPTPTPTPIWTPHPTFSVTPQAPQESTPAPIFGHFSTSDIDNIVVIAIAFSVAAAIIITNKPEIRENH